MKSPSGASFLAHFLVLVALTLAPASAEAMDPSWAQPGKVLRVSMDGEEAGFDPQAANDGYSATVMTAIFESLYEYLYLGGAQIVPRTAASMPEISADGRTWRIRLKPGIHFSDDRAFKGVQRELIAQDYVYAWKRLLDPRVRSGSAEILAERILGARAAIDKAKHSGRFDYDAEIEGLRATDRYTIELKFPEADYTLLPYLTSPALSAVAREVVETYGDDNGRVMEHPVGTGPYRLIQWRRGQKIVLEANLGYREEYFPAPPKDADPATRALAKAMTGKRLPQIGRVETASLQLSAQVLHVIRQLICLIAVRFYCQD